MKIVAFTTQPPVSAAEPGCPRLFSLCRELAKEHSITLLCPMGNAEPSTLDNLNSVYTRCISIPSEPEPQGLRQRLHTLSLSSVLDPRVRNPQFVSLIQNMLDRAFNEFPDENGSDTGVADVIIARSLDSSFFIPERLRSRTVLDLVDSTSMLMRRSAPFQKSLHKKISTLIEAYCRLQLEKKAVAEFPAVITISPLDAKNICGNYLAETHNISVVRNGIDSQWFPKDSSGEKTIPPLPTSPIILFSGVMDYEPNTDAALFFAEEIFPLIRQKNTNAQFWVVGKNPPPAVTALNDIPGIRVTGEVPDVLDCILQCRVAVSPLRMGSGVKNKVLQGLAATRPMVITSLSAEGIAVEDNKHLLVRDKPESIAAAIVELLDNDALAERLRLAGRSLLDKEYSWKASAHIVNELLYKVAESGLY